jgi:hypothetical protein
MIRTIRPTLAGSIWAVVVGVFSLFLLAVGLSSLAGSHPDLLRVVVSGGLGAYGLFNVLQTPVSLGLQDGELVLRGLLVRHVRAADLDRVELARGGLARPWVWRFLLKDGRRAFETDAGLWRQGDFRELMKAAGVRVEPRG